MLTWYENLPKEEVPPEYLWEDSEGLEQWWARIEDKRSDGEPSSTEPRKQSVPDGDGDDDPPPGMAENDYARALKG